MKFRKPDHRLIQKAIENIYQEPRLDKSLQQVLKLLQSHMPLEQISLHFYDIEKGIIYNYAIATEKECCWVESRILATPKLRKFFWDLDTWVKALGESSVFMMRFDNFVEQAREMGGESVLTELGIDNSSGAIMDLIHDEMEIGFMLVSAKKGFIITEDHLRLLNSLNDLFATMLNIDLQIRNLKRTYLQPDIGPDSELKRPIIYAEKKIVGAESGLRSVMDKVRLVAPLSTTVLLIGETGTGKEMIANAIVSASDRNDRPYIKVNCAAIPSTLLEGELFGHEKGAFTGAIALKRGYFERAQGGTIFLDEIGELSPDAQTRLLRVIQEKEVERIGGRGAIPLDIRVIAATHRNLEQLVLDGDFREDLYFRLKVFPVEIPPLRNRRSDIEPLIRHIVAVKTREMKLQSPPAFAIGEIKKLIEYSWPGNVRELENMIERSLILCQDRPLVFDSLRNEPAGIKVSHTENEAEIMDLSLVIKSHIEKALRHCNGRVEGKYGAAALLNLNPSTLRTRMKKLGVPFGRNSEYS